MSTDSGRSPKSDARSPIHMRRVSDWIRNQIERSYGVLPLITLEEIQEYAYRRVEPTIYTLAKARLEMGFVRYESRLGAAPDYLRRIKQMVEKYESTRNREFLVDLLNFVLLEWTTPTIENTYFECDDSSYKSDSEVSPSP